MQFSPLLSLHRCWLNTSKGTRMFRREHEPLHLLGPLLRFRRHVSLNSVGTARGLARNERNSIRAMNILCNNDKTHTVSH